MKQIFLPLLISMLLTISSFTEYQEGKIVGVVAHSPNQNWVVQLNSYTEGGMALYPADEWHTVDVSGFAPLDTKAVFVEAILIITHGQTQESCSNLLYLRNYNDTVADMSPVGYATAQLLGTGARQNYSGFVPITDGKFDFKWERSTIGEWPEHCSYGLAIKISAYIR